MRCLRVDKPHAWSIGFSGIMATKDLDDWDLPAMRSWSDLVFGSPHRLPVAVLTAAATPKELYAACIARRVGTDRKEARRLLGDLERAKVLAPATPPPGSRPRGRPPEYLWRCDDEFWSCIQQLGERYRRRPPNGS
jgi:hypothetical protein